MNTQKLIGRRFSRLIVTGWFRKRTGRTKPRSKIFCRCTCDCGNKVIVDKACLMGGHTKSCRCYHIERARDANIKHGKCNSRTYKIWRGMIQRCTNPNHKYYKDYGGRGIVCDPAWIASFINFFKDIGEIPIDLTIERKDNNIGYFKDNIIFASRKQQANNTRKTIIISWRGRTQSLAYWADELGIDKGTLRYRIFTRHWPIKDAFTKRCFY